MNVRPVVGIGKAALNVDVWVFPAAADLNERMSAHGKRRSSPECLRVGPGCHRAVRPAETLALQLGAIGAALF